MKIKVKDLLDLNKKKVLGYLVEEFSKLFEFEEPEGNEILPEMPEDFDERDVTSHNFPFVTYELTNNIRCSTGDREIDLEDIDKAIDDQYSDTQPMGIYAIFVDYYEGKPMLLRMWNGKLHCVKMYILNTKLVNKFRYHYIHDYMHTFRLTVEQCPIFRDFNYDDKTYDVTNLPSPYMSFDSNTVIDDDVRTVFEDKMFDGVPCVHDTVIQFIVGYAIDGDPYFKPLKLIDVPRVSLHLLSDVSKDISDVNEYDTVWLLKLDGVDTLIYSVEDGYYVDSDDVYLINQIKFSELKDLVYPMYAPRFKPFDDGVVISLDDEIDITGDEILTHEICDKDLVLIVNI